MLLLASGRVVTPDGVLDPGWIRLAGPLIDAVGSGRVQDQSAVDLRGQWVLPGFVDMHVHGGGGASFTEGTSDQARQAAAFHRGQGSTTVLASLVTAPLAELEARAGLLAGLAGDGDVAGLHLEGPFLSPVRRGAQDPRHMIAPDVAVFERLHAAARGHLRVITLAPELPGALAVIQAATYGSVLHQYRGTTLSSGPILVATIGLFFMNMLSWAPYVSDYSRYLPKNVRARGPFWAVMLGNAIPTIFLGILGGYIGSLLPIAGSNVPVAVKTICGIWILPIMAISLIGSDVLNVYTGMLAIATIGSCFRDVRDKVSTRVVGCGLLLVAGVLAALFGYT